MDVNNHRSQPLLPIVNWQFPAAAKFGRVISKEKLYQQVSASQAVKQLFVEQVSQIKWAYKLSDATVNLAKTENVHELEVIHIKLKNQQLDEKILDVIDKAIPHPTLFLLTRQVRAVDVGSGEDVELGENIKLGVQHATEMAYQAAHKCKVSTHSNKETWQRSQYLKSQWVLEGKQPAMPLPAATHLESLYCQLLEALMPPYVQHLQQSKGYSLQEKLIVLAEIETLNKQIKQIKTKRDKEKQFNRRLELNDQFKTLKKQLAMLTE